MSIFDENHGKIRVILVEDCPSMRTALAALLSQAEHIEVVGVAQDGVQSLELVEVLSPDVIVTDLEMPKMHGADFVVRQMSKRPIPIIVFSAVDESDPLAELALESGAADFLRKPAKIEEVLTKQQLLHEKILQSQVHPSTRNPRASGLNLTFSCSPPTRPAGEGTTIGAGKSPR